MRVVSCCNKLKEKKTSRIFSYSISVGISPLDYKKYVECVFDHLSVFLHIFCSFLVVNIFLIEEN